jgi:hypothetical protein
MKKILVIGFVLMSFYSMAQEIYPMGNGIYVCKYKKGTAGWAASEKTKKITRKFVEDYAKEKNADYEIISFDEAYTQTTRPTITIKFRLVNESVKIATESSSVIASAEYNPEGKQTSVVITNSTPGKSKSEIKKDAIAELRELKSLLKDGIITQAEYDEKAKNIKKIILE